ncbi:hypothetical protein EVB27_097 [Rhizobium phage RHph_TM16]|nr:hypothetical protein EVB27_097 [Rhizobium phage RHph_TM16]
MPPEWSKAEIDAFVDGIIETDKVVLGILHDAEKREEMIRDECIAIIKQERHRINQRLQAIQYQQVMIDASMMRLNDAKAALYRLGYKEPV